MIKRFLTISLILVGLTAAPVPALAQGNYQLGVPLGELKEVSKGDAFRQYVIGLYKYVVGLAIVLAAIVSTYAGYLWLTSGGDPAKIGHARELIIGALSGLALLLLASTVLNLIGGQQSSQPSSPQQQQQQNPPDFNPGGGGGGGGGRSRAG